MKTLLFLSHRIPYPPNKGDKIRSYHLLKHLSRSYRICLGTFIDDPADRQYRSDLEKYCHDVCIRPLNPVRAKLRSLAGLLDGRPLSLPYYFDRTLAQWIKDAVKNNDIKQALVFSSPMAQYLQDDAYAGIRRVADFVDVDSDKWRQYSASKRWPMSRLYQREARCLQRYEIAVTGQFDRTLFVSRFEAEMFQGLAAHLRGKIDFFNNGVDTAYFTPAMAIPNPYSTTAPVLVFTGLMDYWANIDAVTWFVHEVLPAIRNVCGNVLFYIVGANPTAAVSALQQYPGVSVTGKVADVRPYVAHAWGSVAPLRIARGVQNKVLEAMAMAKPVIATTAATRGISDAIGPGCLIADTPTDFADRCVQLIQTANRAELGKANRRFVEAHFEWDANLRRIDTILQTNTGFPESQPGGIRHVGSSHP